MIDLPPNEACTGRGIAPLFHSSIIGPRQRCATFGSKCGMKRLLQLLILPILLTSCGKRPGGQVSATDTPLAEKVVGTWIQGEDKPGIGWSGGVTTIRRDRTYTSRSTNRWNGGSREFAYEGTWAVQGQVLLFTYTKSTEPKGYPVGSTQRCEIVRLDDRELASRDLSQDVTKVWVMHRSKQQ
jgi:hypothetical protein